MIAWQRDYKSIKDYQTDGYSLLRRLYNRGVLTEDPTLGHVFSLEKQSRVQPVRYTRETRTPIEFRDGAELSIRETFYEDGQGVVIEEYAYHYQRARGVLIRFEHEAGQTPDEYWKPSFHLHVATRVPHYPTPPMSFPALLEFLARAFYPDEWLSERAADSRYDPAGPLLDALRPGLSSSG